MDASSASFNTSGLAAAAMLDYPPMASSLGGAGVAPPSSRLSLGAADSLTSVGSRLYSNNSSSAVQQLNNNNADLFYGDGRSVNDVIGGGGGRDRDRERDREYSSRSMMGDRFMSSAGNGGSGAMSAGFYDQGLAPVKREAMSPLSKS